MAYHVKLCCSGVSKSELSMKVCSRAYKPKHSDVCEHPCWRFDIRVCVFLHGGTAQSKKNHLPRNKQVQSGRFKKTNNCIMCSSYCPRYWQWFSGWTLEQGLLEKCLSRRPWSESSSGRCRTDKRDTPVGALRSTWGAHWFGRIIIGRHELATNL